MPVARRIIAATSTLPSSAWINTPARRVPDAIVLLQDPAANAARPEFDCRGEPDRAGADNNDSRGPGIHPDLERNVVVHVGDVARGLFRGRRAATA